MFIWCMIQSEIHGIVLYFCLDYIKVFLSLRLKGELAYNYKGPRTKDDIIEFANRVAG